MSRVGAYVKSPVNGPRVGSVVDGKAVGVNEGGYVWPPGNGARVLNWPGTSPVVVVVLVTVNVLGGCDSSCPNGLRVGADVGE